MLDSHALLKIAEQFCVFGPSYNRSIHAAAADLRSAINAGYPDRILEHLAGVLMLRLNG